MLNISQAQPQPNFANLWNPEPTTPNEWLMRWFRDKRITVPTENQGVTTLDIDKITVPRVKSNPRPDALITIKGGYSFYIIFPQDCVYRPMDKPTLVIPDASLERAWWLLNE